MSPLRHDVRPRADCPGCGRSISVTFNARTGEAYLREHLRHRYDHMQGERVSEPCAQSRRLVPHSAVHQPARDGDQP